MYYEFKSFIQMIIERIAEKIVFFRSKFVILSEIYTRNYSNIEYSVRFQS